MGQNEMQWSTATPGLMIILIDQSGSMLQSYGSTGDNKSVFASKCINRVIDDIIQKNFNGDKPKNRCFVSVIGYNQDVNELCSGWLTDLDANPKRIDTIKQKISDGAGGLLEINKKMPIWVDPIDCDGVTNMKGAFETAKKLCEKWFIDHPDYPAPVIINISDGVPYYERKDVHQCMQETIEVVNSIKSLKNSDGNVVIFNAHIGEGNPKVQYPSSRSELNGVEEAEFLFDITSDLPQGFEEGADKNGLRLKASDGVKCCVFNAQAEDLIGLINFGSSKGNSDKGL